MKLKKCEKKRPLFPSANRTKACGPCAHRGFFFLKGPFFEKTKEQKNKWPGSLILFIGSRFRLLKEVPLFLFLKGEVGTA